MTSEVAGETRRNLLLHQAILARLGTMRAMSFRGVTPLGNDIYTVHFANGSAEWRVGVSSRMAGSGELPSDPKIAGGPNRNQVATPVF